MRVIAEFEKPKNCKECPCCHLTEGAYHDYCGLLGYETEFPIDFNYFKETLKNCPLVANGG